LTHPMCAVLARDLIPAPAAEDVEAPRRSALALRRSLDQRSQGPGRQATLDQRLQGPGRQAKIPGEDVTVPTMTSDEAWHRLGSRFQIVNKATRRKEQLIREFCTPPSSPVYSKSAVYRAASSPPAASRPSAPAPPFTDYERARPSSTPDVRNRATRMMARVRDFFSWGTRERTAGLYSRRGLLPPRLRELPPFPSLKSLLSSGTRPVTRERARGICLDICTAAPGHGGACVVRYGDHIPCNVKLT